MSSIASPGRGRRSPAAALAALGVLGLLAALAAASPPLALRAAIGLFLGGALVGLAVLVWNVDAAWTLTAAALLAIFAGNWEELHVPGPLSPQRIFLIAAVGVVLLRAPKEVRRPPMKLGVVHFLLATALLYAVVSAFAAGTLLDRQAFFELFDNFGLLPFLVFPVAALAFRTERRRNILLVGFVALGAYLGITAILESVNANALIFPRYILDDSVGTHADRARGPFVEAATNGLAMYTCATAAAVAFVRWNGRRAKAIALAVIALSVVGILLTLTRQAWAAAVVATVLTLVAVPALRRLLVPAVALSFALVAVTLVAVPDVSERVQERGKNKRTVWERKNNNRTAMNMLQARPLIGFGWNTFVDHKTDYFTQAETYPPAGAEGRTVVHNLPILYAAELGLVGLGLFLAAALAAVLGGVLRRGPPELNPWRVALLAEAIAFSVIAMFEFPGIFSSLCLWLWAGVVWSGAYATDEPEA